MGETDEFGQLRRVEGSGGPPDEFGRLESVEGRAAINPGSEPFVFTPLEPLRGRPGGSPALLAAAPRRVGAVGALLAVGFMSTLVALLLVVNRALPPAVLERPSSLPSAAEIPEINAVAEPSSEGSFEPVSEPQLGPAVRTGTVAVGPTSSPAGTPTSGSDQGNLPRDEDRAVKEDDRGGNGGGRGGGGGDGDGDGGTGGGGGDGDGDGGTGGGGGDGGGGGEGVPKSRTHPPGKAKGHDKDHDKGRGHNGSPGHENGHGHGKGKAKGHGKDHSGGGSSNGGGGTGRGGGGSPGEAGKGHAKGRGNAGGQGKGHAKGRGNAGGQGKGRGRG